MALKLGNRVTVKAGPLAGKRGEVVQIGTGPHVRPTNVDTVKMDEATSATCPDPAKPILVDSQWVNGNPQGSTGMRDWFTEEELELG